MFNFICNFLYFFLHLLYSLFHFYFLLINISFFIYFTSIIYFISFFIYFNSIHLNPLPFYQSFHFHLNLLHLLIISHLIYLFYFSPVLIYSISFFTCNNFQYFISWSRHQKCYNCRLEWTKDQRSKPSVFDHWIQWTDCYSQLLTYWHSLYIFVLFIIIINILGSIFKEWRFYYIYFRLYHWSDRIVFI